MTAPLGNLARTGSVLFLLATTAARADNTWVWDNGGAGSNWTTAGNWDKDTVPPNDGTATIVITNFHGSAYLDGDWDIDTLVIGNPTGSTLNLYNYANTLKIRSALVRTWPIASSGYTYLFCKLALGANPVAFANNFAGRPYLYSPVSDGGLGYDWLLSGSLDMQDSGTGAVASTFAGRVLQRGGAVYVRGDHAFPSALEWTVVNNGSLWPVDAGAKLGSGTRVVLRGGGLVRQAGSESFGDLVLAGGLNTLRPTATTTLLAARVMRGATTPGARALTRLHGVDGTSNFIKLNETNTLGLVGGDGSRTTNKPIVPHLFDYAAAANAFRTLHTYDAVNGIVPLNTATDFVRNTDTNFPAVHADGHDNVLISIKDMGGTIIQMAGNATVNSLVIHSDNNSWGYLDLGGYTLTIKSGVLIANNDYNSTAQAFKIQNGTIHVGATELVILSSMGGVNTGFQPTCPIVGSNGLTVHNTGTGPVLLGTNPDLSGTYTLVDCARRQLLVYDCIDPSTVIVGTANAGWSTTLNIVQNSSYNQSLAVREVQGTVQLRPGHSLAGGYSGMVVGGARSDHVRNHIQLLGNGVLSPHGVGISHPDQTELDGGVIGLSAMDGSYLTGSKVPFTVALRGGQVVIDLFGPANHDQLKVLLSDGGQANLAMSGGEHAGSELVVRLHYAPDPSDTFTIVEVAGASAITGKLSNGDKVAATYQSKKYVFDIQYNVGVNGNDIVLANAVAQVNGTVLTIR